MILNQPPWMPAMESQLEALTMIERLFNLPGKAAQDIVNNHGFTVDRALLPKARPFFWEKDITRIVWEASKSIPGDTRCNTWNFETEAVWWYFEEPLPVKTIELPDAPSYLGVRALCFGWLEHAGQCAHSLGISAWCDAHDGGIEEFFHVTVTPSQTWVWQFGQTLDATVTNARDMHEKIYGPGGRWHDRPTIGIDHFCQATDELSRFILAGMTWLNQQILVEKDAHVERHRRKEFERKTKRPLAGVRVVHLRKIKHDGETTTATLPVEWSCHWLVSGHWRNQPHGPGMKDRRLRYINPYLKGDEAKPFRELRPKVYEVDR